jgi:hypothetical protein
MDTREIAKELAVACLSHAHVAAMFRPVATAKTRAAEERFRGARADSLFSSLSPKIISTQLTRYVCGGKDAEKSDNHRGGYVGLSTNCHQQMSVYDTKLCERMKT